MTFSLRRSRPLASSAIKLLTLAVASLSPVSNALYCDGPPSAGCTNGLWNEAECHCDCIPPFCRDVYGACSLGVCGASAVAAWADCEAGLNCPWWVNPLKTERCTTGPEVRLFSLSFFLEPSSGYWEFFAIVAVFFDYFARTSSRFGCFRRLRWRPVNFLMTFQ